MSTNTYGSEKLFGDEAKVAEPCVEVLNTKGHTFEDTPRGRRQMKRAMQYAIGQKYGMGFLLTAILSGLISKIIGMLIEAYWSTSTARRQ